jgi:hypothetical protein
MRHTAAVGLAGLLVAAGVCVALGPATARADPLADVDAFLAAVTDGDVGEALALLDEGAVYEGLLVCPPGGCVGRAAIAVALASEVDDGTQFDLWLEAATQAPGAVTGGGGMRCRSLAPRRVAFTLLAEVGPGGITALRLRPDESDPETRWVLEGLAAVQALLDEASAAGSDAAIVLGAAAP